MEENFRRPFFSRNLAEYWRRWHISLGTWIKDYVFYPIAMSKTFGRLGRKAKERWGSHIGKALPGALTSVITFVLIGLWHDVTVNYLLYGLWHGSMMGLSAICEPLCRRFTEKMKVNTECISFCCFQRFRTWMLVSIGEYFSLAAGIKMLRMMFSQTLFHFEWSAVIVKLSKYSLDSKDWWVLSWATLLLIAVGIKQEQGICIRERLEQQGVICRWMILTGAICVIAIFGVYSFGYQAGSFIYGGF